MFIKDKKPLKIFAGIFVITFSFLYLANYLKNNSTYFMPKEYKVIKTIVNKIASNNYLGNRDIPFPGSVYMQYRAEEVGL